jgi:CRISPR/Cas system-associated endoribonuclease Cas2
MIFKVINDYENRITDEDFFSTLNDADLKQLYLKFKSLDEERSDPVRVVPLVIEWNKRNPLNKINGNFGNIK